MSKLLLVLFVLSLNVAFSKADPVYSDVPIKEDSIVVLKTKSIELDRFEITVSFTFYAYNTCMRNYQGMRRDSNPVVLYGTLTPMVRFLQETPCGQAVSEVSEKHTFEIQLESGETRYINFSKYEYELERNGSEFNLKRI